MRDSRMRFNFIGALRRRIIIDTFARGDKIK